MATTTLTLHSERWLEEIVLSGTVLDVGDDDMSEHFVLPAGMGDVAIIEVMVIINAITTYIAGSDLAGPTVDVISPDASTMVDMCGAERWVRRSATTLAAYISPDPLVLVRIGEKIRVTAPDADTGTTADLIVFVKAVRIKAAEGVQGPLQLVR